MLGIDAEERSELFSLAYDRRHRVLLASFRGELGSEDITTFDSATEAFIGKEGAAHLLLDFTGVERVCMPDHAIAKRARRPPVCADFKRVVVAPHAEIFDLFCLFAAEQKQIGADGPFVVRSVRSALQLLGLRSVRFAPV